MVELPVFAFLFEQVHRFLAEAEDLWKLLGGKPSVCKNPAKKTQVRFGQDESAFKAYAMNASAWKVDGIQAERDKNDGPGIMLSAFQSSIFGYGMAIPDNVLQKINELRNGEEYADTAHDVPAQRLCRELCALFSHLRLGTPNLPLTSSLSSIIHLATPSKGQMDCRQHQPTWDSAASNQ